VSFHKPGNEKRSVVIVRPDDYEDWLPTAELHAGAFPLPSRPPRAKPTDDGQQSMMLD
jgi:hypothetical protein